MFIPSLKVPMLDQPSLEYINRQIRVRYYDLAVLNQYYENNTQAIEVCEQHIQRLERLRLSLYGM